MLSREQLEAIKNCINIKCSQCSFYSLVDGGGVADGCSVDDTEIAKEMLELLDKTEAQQKEIEKLKAELELHKTTLDVEHLPCRTCHHREIPITEEPCSICNEGELWIMGIGGGQ